MIVCAEFRTVNIHVKHVDWLWKYLFKSSQLFAVHSCSVTILSGTVVVLIGNLDVPDCTVAVLFHAVVGFIEIKIKLLVLFPKYGHRHVFCTIENVAVLICTVVVYCSIPWCVLPYKWAVLLNTATLLPGVVAVVPGTGTGVAIASWRPVRLMMCWCWRHRAYQHLLLITQPQ